MTLPRLKSLLAAWASEKSLHQLVLSDECLLDHFFRYLEETYGCGHLAAHVAHACIMAFDEYVVSIYSDDSCRLLICVLERYGCKSPMTFNVTMTPYDIGSVTGAPRTDEPQLMQTHSSLN